MQLAELNSSGVLSGPLGGKLVRGVLRPGSVVPKGSYMLLPAVQDPIYGSLVRMVPAGGQGTDHAARAVKKLSFVAGESANLPKVKRDIGDAQASAGGFVLSSKAMPGRNNLVVNFGFSDLIEALETGGGMIRVT